MSLPTHTHDMILVYINMQHICMLCMLNICQNLNMCLKTVIKGVRISVIHTQTLSIFQTKTLICNTGQPQVKNILDGTRVPGQLIWWYHRRIWSTIAEFCCFFLFAAMLQMNSSDSYTCLAGSCWLQLQKSCTFIPAKPREITAWFVATLMWSNNVVFSLYLSNIK